MEQLEFFEIPSPCRGVCISGPRGYCQGCYRSREERQYWHQLEDPVKRQIIRACQIREYRHQLALRRNQVDEIPDDVQVPLFDFDEPETNS
ncbi:MAG: DUF1289 domain-containing protein [Saccharospirillum sp.]|nr:DUF1289 domain-containing protein [Saccharospirillum sp.]